MKAGRDMICDTALCCAVLYVIRSEKKFPQLSNKWKNRSENYEIIRIGHPFYFLFKITFYNITHHTCVF